MLDEPVERLEIGGKEQPGQIVRRLAREELLNEVEPSRRTFEHRFVSHRCRLAFRTTRGQVVAERRGPAELRVAAGVTVEADSEALDAGVDRRWFAPSQAGAETSRSQRCS